MQLCLGGLDLAQHPRVLVIQIWIVENHQVFQLGFRANSRFDTRAHLRHRGHPCFERALHFCEHYDQNCFDPEYEHEPIERFAPMVRRHFAAVMRAKVDRLGLST